MKSKILGVVASVAVLGSSVIYATPSFASTTPIAIMGTAKTITTTTCTTVVTKTTTTTTTKECAQSISVQSAPVLDILWNKIRNGVQTDYFYDSHLTIVHNSNVYYYQYSKAFQGTPPNPFTLMLVNNFADYGGVSFTEMTNHEWFPMSGYNFPIYIQLPSFKGSNGDVLKFKVTDYNGQNPEILQLKPLSVRPTTRKPVPNFKTAVEIGYFGNLNVKIQPFYLVTSKSGMYEITDGTTIFATTKTKPMFTYSKNGFAFKNNGVVTSFDGQGVPFSTETPSFQYPVFGGFPVPVFETSPVKSGNTVYVKKTFV